jgi:chromosome segregation ATPase
MTAAAPFPSEGRRPLGEVLLERGIVSREQLATALEQQRSTGQPLGEIIVGFGFAPGPIVAQALATQHGGLIKTEYGFATGWSTDDARAPVAVPAPIDPSFELAKRDRTIAELRDWAQQAQAAIASRDEAIARLQAEVTELRATPEPAVDDAAHQEALEALELELKARREEADAVREQLEAESTRHASIQAELAARDEALAALRAELAAATAQPTTTPAELEEHAAEIERLRTALAELHEASAGREAELTARDEALAALQTELAAASAQPTALLEEHAAEIARLQAELADAAALRETELATRDEALAALQTELAAASAQPTTPRAEVEEHAAQISRLESALATLQTTAEHELAGAHRTGAELERRLENARSRADVLARRITEQEQELEALRTPPATEPNRWASAPMHYVLRRGTGAYDLVERDGPPPTVGDTVDGLRVARVAPAGPGFDVPCAYLAD